MRQDDERCRACACFQPYKHDAENQPGECRAGPPVFKMEFSRVGEVAVAEAESGWPKANPDDWCHAFKMSLEETQRRMKT